ncbi:hypothetical protein G9A89_017026 [Geosiphon pyriformis]|nr:hypothetical protein G9A89_017026 [Geosiphon pyriformis]
METKLSSSTKPWIMNKFKRVRIFSSGLDKGFLGAGVVVIMNNSLTHHVSKVKKVSGCLILVRLLFKDKLLVTFVGLYAGASAEVRFGLASEINFLIAKAVNSSSFVVLGGDFNENGSKKSANYKFCLDIELIHFKELSLAGLLIYSNEFQEVKNNSDLDAMWEALSETLVHAADVSSKFFKLEQLISRIVKAFSSGDFLESDRLVKVWLAVDIEEASKFSRLVLGGAGSSELLKHLSIVKKEYQKSKYYESRASEDAVIKKTINHHMENFCSDKGRMIKSVLEHLFYKVILDHLVVNDELVFEPGEIKLKMPNLWSRQYMLLDYVDNNAFTGVIKEIDMKELSLVVGNLLNEKAAGLLEIPNELWKHCSLENISKAYDLVSWHYLQTSLHQIKMCSQFISFFGNIHKDQINRVIIDFGFSNNYKVHDGLDQGEVFSPLLWRIFYDLLLCEVKRHEHLCSYHINTRFVTTTGRVEAVGGRTFFLVAILTQYILNIASKFFIINDISINNDKTMAILINRGVKNALLLINGLPISIAKKGESHRYLDIFLFMEGLFKPSLA